MEALNNWKKPDRTSYVLVQDKIRLVFTTPMPGEDNEIFDHIKKQNKTELYYQKINEIDFSNVDFVFKSKIQEIDFIEFLSF